MRCFLKQYWVQMQNYLILAGRGILNQFGSGHGESIVHLMCYLKKNTEESGNTWSQELSTLFSIINGERKKRIATENSFTDAEIAD